MPSIASWASPKGADGALDSVTGPPPPSGTRTIRTAAHTEGRPRGAMISALRTLRSRRFPPLLNHTPTQTSTTLRFNAPTAPDGGGRFLLSPPPAAPGKPVHRQVPDRAGVACDA